MDTLSRLLSLYPLRTVLDVRCQFDAPWLLDHAPAGAGIAPYHVIVAGSASLDADGQAGVALEAGDIVLFPRGGPHRLHAGDARLAAPIQVTPAGAQAQALTLKSVPGDGPRTDILCGQFESATAARWPQTGHPLLRALPDVVLVRTAGRDDFAGLQALIGMLRAESATAQPGSAAVVAQLSSALFALLMRAWLEQADRLPGLFALLAEPRLGAALHGMLAAPQQDWTLAQMAAACHMSRATFARLFRHAAATTPAALLTHIRMAQAGLWLAREQRGVASVGEAVGYQSEAAFNRVFKRHFGVGPGQYRRDAQALAV